MSIAVGVFVVGVVTYVGAISLPDMEADYGSANASSALIYTDPFDDTLLTSVRSVPGVSGAEGRTNVQAQMVLPDGNKTPFYAQGIPPASKMLINRFQIALTDKPLGKKEMYLDGSSSLLGFQPGQAVNIVLPDGKIRVLTFKGYIHDVTTIPYAFTGEVQGYVTPDTIEWLGGSKDNNVVLFTVADQKKDSKHVNQVANAISEKIKKGNAKVYGISAYAPGRHFATDIFVAMMAILYILGWLTVFLSVFLVINTINSLMAQHTRQIGIMKSIGGNVSQIVTMYLTLISSFGLISFIISAPLAGFFGYQVCLYMSGFVNFNLRPFHIVPEALVLQALIAFLIPVLSSLIPILNGVHMTVREAVSSYGVGQNPYGRHLIDRALERVRFLSRPVVISLRNSFRRKGRLALTLITLTLGGAIFIAVFNLWGAIGLTMSQIEGYFMADININFTRQHRDQKIKDLVMSIPGVVGYEGWKASSGVMLSDDKKGQLDISFLAPPVDSTLIHPILTSGRWLAPGDQNAIVIGNHVIKERPDLKVDDDVIIKVKEKEYSFHIVGIYRVAGNIIPPIVYANKDYLARITDTPGQISEARIITDQHDLETQRRVGQALQDLFKSQGIQISYVQMGVEWRQQQISSTDVMIYFFLVMAFLIALVGGLGLTGTMGMNILERFREIGVMRAIGASDSDIQQIVVLEGIVIGIISWFLGVILSIPITFILNYGVGVSMFAYPLDFVFGYQGIIAWLVGVTLIATLSSIVPAINASRLTIREVLAYE